MQKTLFYIFSAICLAVLISVSSVKAQSFNHYQGNIPFDFSVGKDTYKAGEYAIDVQASAGSVVWTLLDSNHKVVQTFAITKTGAVSRNEKSSLTFDKVEGSYILNKMTTPAFGLKIPNSYVTVHLSAKNPSPAKSKPEMIAILLK